MAKDLKAGDTFTLEFRVTGNWGDGQISATNPHLPAPITINEGEIADATVTRGKPPPEPAQEYHYEVMVGRDVIMGTKDRKAAYALKEDIGATAKVAETPISRPGKKR